MLGGSSTPPCQVVYWRFCEPVTWVSLPSCWLMTAPYAKNTLNEPERHSPDAMRQKSLPLGLADCTSMMFSSPVKLGLAIAMPLTMLPTSTWVSNTVLASHADDLSTAELPAG